MGRLSTLLIGFIAAILAVAVVILVFSFLQNRFLPAAEQPSLQIESPYPSANDVYQVEVRNGVGVNGVAERMRTYLRTKNYDVVWVGNHSSFDQEETIVVDRRGNLDISRNIVATLGLPEDRISQEIRDEYHLDASIIIGKDYGLIPPFVADTLSETPD
ncbi:MAG: LytR C-terminal domain-containing protein [Bacteroidota bacterium]|nr:LytR C-terminal domain-containing protein [Bacteroidota bacterium]MDE2835251.1 LytR C-terminal domain-containing protein [Bacteroidota bacterium]MDE2957527.1 LytR C-terminal domain-containing protein [Bacteroidota bacterium]